MEVVWAARSGNLLAESGTGEAMRTTAVICDDHPAFARGLAGLLRDEPSGVDVVAITTTADEAAAAVLQLLPDVVLMDIRLPGVDGIEATRLVREASPTTQVVMLTASEDESDLYAALRSGASGYVTKDKDVSEIAQAVQAVRRGHLVIPAHLAGHFMLDLTRSGPSLTEMDREILAGIARAETNRELAARLHMSERSVRRRVADLYARLHLSDRIEAALYAAERGLGDGR